MSTLQPMKNSDIMDNFGNIFFDIQDDLHNQIYHERTLLKLDFIFY